MFEIISCLYNSICTYSLIAGLADTVDVGRGDRGTDGAGVGTFEPPAVPERVVDKWWIPDG